MKREVLKFNEFINEAKESQGEKESKKDKGVELLKKLLNSKKVIEMGENYPTEKGIYSLAGIKRYFKDNGMTNNDADQALNKLQNDKSSDLKNVKVKNSFYSETYPCYYMALSDSEAKEVKMEMEKWSKDQAKPEIEKRKEIAKKAAESKSKRGKK